MNADEIRDAVFEALNNAAANGYTIYSAEREAVDLVTFDASLEDCTPEEVLPAIEEWIKQRDSGNNGHAVSL